MDIRVAELVNWLVLGVLAGGFVGALFTGKKAGYGWFKNLGLGLIGGLLGGLLFVKLIDLDFGMSEIKITMQELVAAILGTMIVVVFFWLLKKRKGKPTA